MNYDVLLNALSKLGISSESVKVMNGEKAQISCPLAHWFHSKKTDSKPSMTIYYGATPCRYYCWACGEKGRLWQLLDSVGSLTQNQELRDYAQNIQDFDKPTLSSLVEKMYREEDWIKPIKKETAQVLNEQILRRFPRVEDSVIAKEYVRSRGINDETCRLHDLRFDPLKNRVVYPIRDREKKLVGAVGRILNNIEGEVKYYNYFGCKTGDCLGGENLVFRDCKRILVVEGFFCLVVGYQWARLLDSAIVCTFHAGMTEIQATKLLYLDKPVYIYYDTDKAGDKGWQQARNLLRGKCSLKRAKLPLGKDVAKLTFNEFKELLRETEEALHYG